MLTDDVAYYQASIDNEIANRTTQLHSLNAAGTEMTLSGMATMGDLVVSKSVKVGSLDAAGVTAAGYDDSVSLGNGDFDGMMFYYSGADGANAAFPDGAKWYFCEGQTWFASVFHTEDT